MEETKIKFIENPWILFLFQIILSFLQFGSGFGGGGSSGRVLVIFLGLILSLYPIFISIKKIYKLKEKASIGYIVLILSSVYIGWITYSFIINS